MDSPSFFVAQSQSSTAGLMDRFLDGQVNGRNQRGTSSASRHVLSRDFWRPYSGEDLLGEEPRRCQMGRTIYTAAQEPAAASTTGEVWEAEHRVSDGQMLAAWKEEQRVRRDGIRTAHWKGKGVAWQGKRDEVDDTLSPSTQEAISPPMQVEQPNAYGPARTDVFDPFLYQGLLAMEALHDEAVAKAEDLLVDDYFQAFIDEGACGSSEGWTDT